MHFGALHQAFRDRGIHPCVQEVFFGEPWSMSAMLFCLRDAIWLCLTPCALKCALWHALDKAMCGNMGDVQYVCLIGGKMKMLVEYGCRFLALEQRQGTGFERIRYRIRLAAFHCVEPSHWESVGQLLVEPLWTEETTTLKRRTKRHDTSLERGLC